MKKLFYFLIFFPLITWGQKVDDIISLRIGLGSTNILFKEAYEPTINIFGNIYNLGKNFVGDGIEFGISKAFSNKIYIDIFFSSFSGRNTKAKVNNNENFYTLKGLKVPITVNYLSGDKTKRLRINLGTGLQYLKGHLQQYETIDNNSVQVTNQITDINISEIQLALRPGVQFQIIQSLYASFIVTVGISQNGRYSDNPCFSLKYTFKAKK